MHEWQHRCQEDPVSLHSGGLEKTTRSSPHYVAQKSKPSNRIWNNTTLRSPKQQIGSEPPSVEDDVDVWHYAILELHARNDDDDIDPSCHPWCDSVAMWNVCVCVFACLSTRQLLNSFRYCRESFVGARCGQKLGWDWKWLPSDSWRHVGDDLTSDVLLLLLLDNRRTP